MKVLSLTSKASGPVYQQQVKTLRAHGVQCRTVSVPGSHGYSETGSVSRSPLSYLRFVPTVVRHSFGDFDLVHANYGLTAPAALAQLRLPVVLSLWGSDLYGEYGWLSKLSARFADVVIVRSPEMAAELDRDCEIVPHGVDLDLFRPQPAAAARAELGWGEGHHVLFPYSTERPVKNYPLARAVVDAVADRFDAPVTLQTVTGERYERMPLYYNAADSLLVTSDSEGSPNTVKEAMACNLPVVSTDVGDVADRLDGVSPSRIGRSRAELVESLAAVLEADARSNGREHVRDTSLDQMGSRLVDIYERVAARA